MIFILPLIFTLVATISAEGSYPPYGQLQVVGPHITDLNGNVVQLRGMSFYYSQWKAKFYNLQTVQALRSAWNANVVRIAMGTDRGGYLTNPEKEWTNVKNVIEAAIETGIYVIVDWHIIGANPNKDKALAFFSNISQTYGCYPHIIYEIWNEPANTTWDVVKAYANELIPAIRRYDPNNIIVVGTTTWSQDNDIAANDPITGYSNIAYALHYYAGTHKQSLRNKTIAAINKGLPIFVTEYGTSKVGGGDNVTYTTESNTWWAFDDQYKLSYVNWHLSDVDELAAALLPNTSASQVGDPAYWRSSGILVNQKYQKTDQGLGKPLVPFPLSTCV
uniref:Glycoside hydrolase family 5 domain-containing protein n=1 Tax=Acrobeloides nanus TaxID=290746 RepID=A0A914DYK7_9BILA